MAIRTVHAMSGPDTFSVNDPKSHLTPSLPSSECTSASGERAATVHEMMMTQKINVASIAEATARPLVHCLLFIIRHKVVDVNDT